MDVFAIFYTTINFLMKLSTFFFCLIACLWLARCKSPSDHIKDAFKTIDRSLEKSNNFLGNTIEQLYSAIDANRPKNEQLAAKADTIFFAASTANNLLDGLKKKLRLQDPSGTNDTIAMKLFEDANTRDSLTQVLLNVYRSTKSYRLSKTKRPALDSTLQQIAEMQNDPGWTNKYFKATQTVVATTRLSKFQMDCRNAAAITLSDIKEKLTE